MKGRKTEPHTKELQKRVAEMRRSGLSRAAIASRLHYSETYISRMTPTTLKQPRRRPDRVKDARVAELRRKGLTLAEVAKRLGLSTAAVWNREFRMKQEAESEAQS